MWDKNVEDYLKEVTYGLIIQKANVKKIAITYLRQINQSNAPKLKHHFVFFMQFMSS